MTRLWWACSAWLVVAPACTWIDQASYDEAIDRDDDGVTRDVDCDDTDPAVGVPPTWYADADGDGHGAALSTRAACAAPDGFVADGTDCDDTDAAVFPGAPEVCGGRDDDCDGLVDDLDPSLGGSLPQWVPDADGDGVAAPGGADVVGSCAAPADHVALPGAGEPVDCDDDDPASFPGATEVCDGADNDCDGDIDDDVDPDGPGDPTAYLPDEDGDGWPFDDDVARIRYFCAGDEPEALVAVDAWEAAVVAAGSPAVATDCDDDDPAVHPGATDIWYDGEDTDCDGASDFDADGDGEDTIIGAYGTDCDDDDPAQNTAGTESCNGEDDDCDGDIDEAGGTVAYYVDADGDGWPPDLTEALRCSPAAGWVAATAYDDAVDAAGLDPVNDVVLDCRDDRYLAYPGAPDLPYDGLDDDCQGDDDYDADGDGHAAEGLEGAAGDDCDDGDPAVSPSADERCATAGVDDDCDGEVDERGATDGVERWLDADGDGFTATELGEAVLSCAADDDLLDLWVGGDCDDDDPGRAPDLPEVADDGIDQDCSGADTITCYVDDDGDGHAGLEVDLQADGLCDEPGLYMVAGDCDDEDPAVAPGVYDRCDDIDNDCDGQLPETITGFKAGGDPFDPADDEAVDLSAQQTIALADYTEVRVCGGTWSTVFTTDGAGPDDVLQLVGQGTATLKQVVDDDLDVYASPGDVTTGPVRFDEQEATLQPPVFAPASAAWLEVTDVPTALVVDNVVVAPDHGDGVDLDLSGIDAVTLERFTLQESSPLTLTADALAATDLVIRNDVAHAGSSLVLDDPDGDSVITGLTVEGGSVEVVDGVADIADGVVSDADIGLVVHPDAELVWRDGEVATCEQAAMVEGTLNLSNTTVHDNGPSTGHVYVADGGVLTTSGAWFEANHSEQGGALFGDLGSFVVLANTDFVSNSADLGGGAVLRGVTTAVDSSWTSNDAIDGGGALVQGSAQLVATTFGGNTATRGAALHLGDSDGTQGGTPLGSTLTDVVVVDGRISDNVASDEGGGGRIADGADLLMQQGTLAANDAGKGAGGGLAVVDGAVEIQGALVASNVAELGGGGAWVGPDGLLVDCGSTWATNGDKAGLGGAWYLDGGEARVGGAGAFDANEALIGPLAWVGPGALLTNTTCDAGNAMEVSNHVDPTIFIAVGGTYDARGWVVTGTQVWRNEATGTDDPL